MQNIFKPRKPNRLKEYDYSEPGYYYITICTFNRREMFGSVENNNMLLNQCGNIAQTSWLDLPNHHKNIHLDRFIVMPNHIHGIIEIKYPVGGGPARPFNKKNNISVIIGSYKSTVSKQINKGQGRPWTPGRFEPVVGRYPPGASPGDKNSACMGHRYQGARP